MAGSFTFLLFWVFDRLPSAGEVKFGLIASPDTAAGSFSLELYSDGSVRCWSRHATDGYVIRRTAGGLVAAGVPVAIGYSRSNSDGGQRVWVDDLKYQVEGDFPQEWSGPDPTPSPDPDDTWDLPPAGQTAVGAYFGGINLFSGMLRHIIYWDFAVGSAVVLGLTAERLAAAVWLDDSLTIDFGTVEVLGNSTREFFPFVHPEEGYQVVIDSQPATATATANADGLRIDFVGGPATAVETFTFHVTVGVVSSAIATGQIETVDAGPSQDGSPKPSTDLIKPRQSSSGAPLPHASDRIENRSTGGAGAPSSSNEPVRPRAEPT